MILVSRTFQHLLLDANMGGLICCSRPFFSFILLLLSLSPSLSLTDPLIPFELTWGESLIAKSEQASVSSTMETFWMGTVSVIS